MTDTLYIDAMTDDERAEQARLEKTAVVTTTENKETVVYIDGIPAQDRGIRSTTTSTVNKYLEYFRNQGVNIDTLLSSSAPLFTDSIEVKKDFSGDIEQWVSEEMELVGND